MSEPVIQAIDLRKTYFGKIDTPVLKGLDFEIRPGEFVAIMGQSGSGKSTLLNILGCLDRATGGTLLLDGQNVADLNDNELAELRSASIGFVFQFHFLLDAFTCEENCLMPLWIRYGKASKENHARIIRLMERVGLGDVRDHTPDSMSGGQNQRCAIVRALANNPRIILADEPTGNLDRKAGEEVFALMREMNRETGAAVVLVTHDDRLAREADRILSIDDGFIHQIAADQLYRGASAAIQN